MASNTYTCNIAQSTSPAKTLAGGDLSVHGTIETSLSYTTTDMLLLKKVTAGEVIDSIHLITSGHPAGAQIKVNIGDSVDADRYADSLSLLPDAVYNGVNVATGFNYTYSADDILRLTFDTAASTTATSTLKVIIRSHKA